MAVHDLKALLQLFNKDFLIVNAYFVIFEKVALGLL